MSNRPTGTRLFKKVMNRAGFYRRGNPTPGLIEAQTIAKDVERRAKYDAVIDSKKLGASAVFELSGAPCVYFKVMEQRAPEQVVLTNLQRLAWNHGLAPLLWVITPTTVSLYNCYSKPEREPGGAQGLIRSFEQTEKGLRRLNEFAGRLELQSGRFWKRPGADAIDRRHRVDRALLDDLRDAESQLVVAGLEQTVAHALLGRSIFVAYLLHRRILEPESLKRLCDADSFSEVLSSVSATYRLFGWVSHTFNGDLFPLRSRAGQRWREQDVVRNGHLAILQSFFAGTEMKTGQGRLWPYAFDVIPVELISSIYEMFAHSADSEAARSRSVHYTPVNLVDLVLSEVFDGLSPDAKVLDLACGSGVFLVQSFRRLVGLQVAEGRELSRRLVRDTLYKQIYGIDISPEAVQIAAFSLYLTSIELDPDPRPPSALRFRPLIGKNLFANDAFDQTAAFNRREPFRSKGFAAVVGNPPWTRSADNESAMRFCDDHDHSVARKNNPDQAFLWRSGDFVKDRARIGLILHGRPFFSHTRQALAGR